MENGYRTDPVADTGIDSESNLQSNLNSMISLAKQCHKK